MTFNGDVARKNAQDVTYVTERAVFKLHPSGSLELTETEFPGIAIDEPPNRTFFLLALDRLAEFRAAKLSCQLFRHLLNDEP